MKDRIQQILERELNKLDTLSATDTEPLPMAAVKSLDMLIRAYRTFVEPAKDQEQQAKTDPANTPTAQLLEGLLGDEPQDSK